MTNQLQVAGPDEGIRLGGINYPGPITLEATGYLQGDGLALVLITREDGYPELLSKVTVNIDGMSPMPGTVFVKDYSESAGMIALLEQKGWGRRTGRFVRSGFVNIPEVEMIGDLLQFVDEYANEVQR